MKSNDKAVAIAKDVLKQIKYFDIITGSYVLYVDSTEFNKSRAAGNFNKLIKSCKVCALGACYISKAKLYNEVDLEGYNFGEQDDVYANVQAIFGKELSDDIEYAFERGNVNNGDYDVKLFGEYFSDNKARLAAIMQNIVDHDGHFIPGTDGKNAKKYPRKIK